MFSSSDRLIISSPDRLPLLQPLLNDVRKPVAQRLQLPQQLAVLVHQLLHHFQGYVVVLHPCLLQPCGLLTASAALIRSRIAAFIASTSERRNPCTVIMPSPVVWMWMVE